MAIPLGEKCKVFIQTPEGQMMEINCFAVSIQCGMDNEYLQRTHIELEGIGPATWVGVDDFSQAVTMRRSAVEYRCSWCGSPNKMYRTHCSQCGGARDFILGE